ncbi:hypothetical protein L6258_02335 [Candidatus Parcubacteria bacterium]|nr:hypothetical protein [Candidatus Parcubacteria bacterium]
MRKRPARSHLLLLASPFIWFLGASLVLVTVSSYFAFNPDKLESVEKTLASTTQRIFASQPPVLGAFSQRLFGQDARPVIIEQYFESIGAPLAPYGRLLVAEADRLGMDWTLLPAIAMQESNAGKSIPEDTYNPFGWAIHSSYTKAFASWEDAIVRVAAGLKTEYLDKGLVTPEQIMAKYCPLSLQKGGAWAKGVRYFQDLFRNF